MRTPFVHCCFQQPGGQMLHGLRPRRLQRSSPEVPSGLNVHKETEEEKQQSSPEQRKGNPICRDARHKKKWRLAAPATLLEFFSLICFTVLRDSHISPASVSPPPPPRPILLLVDHLIFHFTFPPVSSSFHSPGLNPKSRNGVGKLHSPQTADKKPVTGGGEKCHFLYGRLRGRS